ncbi:MAG TPA: ATP-binding protein, partial [Polyangiaceae bacterium]|nr:ATP-binding protein [Polyangiaceae bacterium]
MNVRSPILVCAAFDAAPDALYVVGPEGLVLEGNRAAFALLERDPERTRGRPFDEIAAPRLGPFEGLVRAARQPDPLDREVCTGGRWWRASADDLRGPGGEALGTLLGLADVTAQRAAREELALRHRECDATARLKDEFLATLSHELRTPLNAVLGWLHLLQSGTVEESARARALETAARHARQQARLVDDVLDVARISAGKLRLQVGELRFDELVRAAVESLRPAAEAKGVSLHLRAEGDLPPLVGDAERLEQAVGNLVSNAIKFSRPAGRVDLTLRPEGPWLALAVRDEGAGIAPDFLPHVFDRFRQQDGSPTREHKGLGLGLALARHFVELHGGEVRAESAGEGRGATFTVRLPRLPRTPRGPDAADRGGPAAPRPG